MTEGEHIYNDKVSTKSMDTLKRIENAEEELRLAKLELLNGDNQTSRNLDEVNDMLCNMSLLPHSYNIIESTTKYVRVEVIERYHFISKYMVPNWSASCTAHDNKLIITFRRK